MKHLFLVLATFVYTGMFAQDNYKTTLEKQLNQEYQNCLDYSNDMLGCVYKYQKKWDEVLNKYYKLLMSVLSEQGKATLRNTQRQWLSDRKIKYMQIENDAKYDLNYGGTESELSTENEKLEITKKKSLTAL